MGLLNNTKVYLAGPIEYSADGKNGVVWRNEITPILHKMGVKVYDPMCKPSWYPDWAKKVPSAYIKNVVDNDNAGQAFHTLKFLERVCYRYAYDCDWMIVYLPREFTVGTIDELRVAVNCGKPIFVICPDLIPSSWALSMVADESNWTESFFKDMNSMLEHIRMINNGDIELDPLKWIFLSYFEDADVQHNRKT